MITYSIEKIDGKIFTNLKKEELDDIKQSVAKLEKDGLSTKMVDEEEVNDLDEIKERIAILEARIPEIVEKSTESIDDLVTAIRDAHAHSHQDSDYEIVIRIESE